MPRPPRSRLPYLAHGPRHLTFSTGEEGPKVRLLFTESPQALYSGLCTIQALGPFSGNRPWRGSSLKVGSHRAIDFKIKAVISVGALAQGRGKEPVVGQTGTGKCPAPALSQCRSKYLPRCGVVSRPPLPGGLRGKKKIAKPQSMRKIR
jgi:hypothetical protein